MVDSWHRSCFRALFSGLGSMQMRISPDYIVAITIRLFQSVGSSPEVITPRFCNLFYSLLTQRIINTGICPAGAVWGVNRGPLVGAPDQTMIPVRR